MLMGGCNKLSYCFYCLQFAIKEKQVVVQEEKTLSLLVSAKQQHAIWDNTTHVKISAPNNNCAALKWTNGSMRLGTELIYLYI